MLFGKPPEPSTRGPVYGLRVNPEEQAYVDEICKRGGMKVSTALRQILAFIIDFERELGSTVSLELQAYASREGCSLGQAAARLIKQSLEGKRRK